MANNTNGKPVAEIRVGRITATIWQNTPTDDGVFYSVHITRLFRRGSTWDRTPAFGRDDLLTVAKVADLRVPERLRSGSDHGFDRDVHGAHLLAGSWAGHLIPGHDRHAGGECDAGRHGRRRRPLQPYSTDPQLLA